MLSITFQERIKGSFHGVIFRSVHVPAVARAPRYTGRQRSDSTSYCYVSTVPSIVLSKNRLSLHYLQPPGRYQVERVIGLITSVAGFDVRQVGICLHHVRCVRGPRGPRLVKRLQIAQHESQRFGSNGVVGRPKPLKDTRVDECARRPINTSARQHVNNASAVSRRPLAGQPAPPPHTHQCPRARWVVRPVSISTDCSIPMIWPLASRTNSWVMPPYLMPSSVCRVWKYVSRTKEQKKRPPAFSSTFAGR